MKSQQPTKNEIASSAGVFALLGILYILYCLIFNETF